MHLRADQVVGRSQGDMNKKLQIPRFQLQRVYEDGSRDEPKVHPLAGIDAICCMGRRGFLLTSAIGAGALAVFSAGCDSKPDSDKPSGEKNGQPQEPPVPELKTRYLDGLAAHLRGARTINFSPDGTMLAFTESPSHVKFWVMPSGKLHSQRDMFGPGRLAFSWRSSPISIFSCYGRLLRGLY